MKGLVLKVEYIPGMTRNDDSYRVLEVINSIDYNPGNYISKVALQTLCNSPIWKIVIVKKGKKSK